MALLKRPQSAASAVLATAVLAIGVAVSSRAHAAIAVDAQLARVKACQQIAIWPVITWVYTADAGGGVPLEVPVVNGNGFQGTAQVSVPAQLRGDYYSGAGSAFGFYPDPFEASLGASGNFSANQPYTPVSAGLELNAPNFKLTGDVSDVGAPILNGSYGVSVAATADWIAGRGLPNAGGWQCTEPDFAPSFDETFVAFGVYLNAGFSDISTSLIAEYRVPTLISSVSPATARQGSAMTAAVFGIALGDATGADFGPGITATLKTPTYSSHGRADFNLVIAPDAPVGPRRVTVDTPRGAIESPPDVVLTVKSATPRAHIEISPDTIDLKGAGSEPEKASVQLTNSGEATLNWTATASTTSGGAWLSVSPTSGSLAVGQSRQIEVRGNPTGLAGDEYAGVVEVKDAAADNSPQSIAVNLLVCGAAARGAAAAGDPFAVCDADVLTLSNVTPPANQEFEQGTEQGFAADITCDLRSRSAADLDLILVDPDSKDLLGASSSIRVRRGDTAAIRLEISPAEIPTGTTRLHLLARLLSNGRTIAESAPVYYPVVPQRSVRLKSASPIRAGTDSAVDVEVITPQGVVDSSFNGHVMIEVANRTNPSGLAALKETQGDAASSIVGVAVSQGRARIWLQTPRRKLTPVLELTPEIPLAGTAALEAYIVGRTRKGTADIVVESPLDLRIEAVRVQHAVEEGGPAVLVHFRPLIVRIFLAANTAEFSSYARIKGISAKLTVRDGAGTDIAGSPFTVGEGAFDTSGRPSLPYVFERQPDPTTQDATLRSGADSLNAVIPVEPLEGDALNISAELNPVYPDRDRSNESKSLPRLGTRSSRPLWIYTAGAVYQSILSGASNPPNPAGIAEAKRFMALAYPLSDGNLRFVPLPENPTFYTFPPVLTTLANKLSEKLTARIETTAYFVDTKFFGLAGESATLRGLSLTYLATVFVASDYCANSDPSLRICGTLSHEVGHQLGLPDTYNNDTGVSGNTVETGSFNWFAGRFIAPTDWIVDFMGNAFDRWVDAYTWNYLRTKLEVPAAGSAEGPMSAAASTSGSLLVQGRIGHDGSGELGSCYTFPDAAGIDAGGGNGSHVIETLDAVGAVGAAFHFTPEFLPPDAEVELPAAPFAFTLPFSGAEREIRLRAGATVLASRQISSNPPAANFVQVPTGAPLTGVRTVTWSGSDLDGDQLRYTLLYSPDGALKIPLVSETAETSYEWNTDLSPAGPAPVLTLVATDGVNAVTVDSAPLVVEDRPPRIVVVSPPDGAEFEVGDPLLLRAALSDLEDPYSLDPPLAWTSDRQGELGTGAAIEATLRAGKHEITVTGEDEAGNLGAETVTVIMHIACVGDCDRSGGVAINELITGVNIALGSREADACLPFDRDGNGTVSIDELVAAVNAALSGCPPAL